jgi:hypothetical protein
MNLQRLMNLPDLCTDKVNRSKCIRETILDMDSSDSPTHGQQEGSAHNGHFGFSYYHSLFVFNHYFDVFSVFLKDTFFSHLYT